MSLERPVRVSRQDDFAVILLHAEGELVEASCEGPPELIKFRQRLDDFAASQDPKFERLTTVVGVGANFGAEALLLKPMAGVNTVVAFGKNVMAALKFARGDGNRVGMLSESALKAYVLAWLQGIFPVDFPPDRGCQLQDVTLTRSGSDAAEGDGAFGWSFYGFIAEGSGCRAAGYVDCQGRLMGDVIIFRTREDYQIYPVNQSDTGCI